MLFYISISLCLSTSMWDNLPNGKYSHCDGRKENIDILNLDVRILVYGIYRRQKLINNFTFYNQSH